MATAVMMNPAVKDDAAYENELDMVIDEATREGYFRTFQDFVLRASGVAAEYGVVYADVACDIRTRLNSSAHTDEVRAAIKHDDVRIKLGLGPIGAK